MKSLLTIIFVTGLSTSTVGSTAHPETIAYDYGKVVSVVPIKEIIRIPENREVCWDEEIQHNERRNRSAGNAILGGIIGGIVGNQVGKGHGRHAATAAGAIIGASIGNEQSKNHRKSNRSYTQIEQRCRITEEFYEEERITGYRVKYTYNGEFYSLRTDNDPGKRIRLRLAITPILN